MKIDALIAAAVERAGINPESLEDTRLGFESLEEITEGAFDANGKPFPMPVGYYYRNGYVTAVVNDAREGSTLSLARFTDYRGHEALTRFMRAVFDILLEQPTIAGVDLDLDKLVENRKIIFDT